MPGLAGIITRKPAAEAKEQLAQMLQTMQHETFYVSGSWSDDGLGIYVGWTSRDESCSLKMPLWHERGDAVMFFAGSDLGRLGNDDSSDARGQDPLISCWEQDPRFPANLNGMFQGIVVDRPRGRILLFNDRYGLHRMYIHESSDGFYFAAEAKAILAVRPQARQLSLRSLGEFVSFGCVLENRTLFQDIQLLPPASTWTFRNAAKESAKTYFDPQEWESQEAADPETYYREIRDVVARIVPRYARGPQKAAVALTGGLDTRLIMTWAEADPGSMPCYTFGGSLRSSRDVVIARKVARMCEQPHEVIQVDQDFLSRFARYAERTVWLTDGTVSLANAPDLYVSEIARSIAHCKLVGTWGSELLRHAITFKPSPLPGGLFAQELADSCRQAEQTYDEVRRCHPLTFAAFRQTPWAQYGVEALEQTQIAIRAPFLDQDFVRTAYRAPRDESADVRSRLVWEKSPQLASIPSDRGVAIGPGNFLKSGGRLMQEFLFKAEYAFDMGMPQWLARLNHAMSPLRMESLFLGRHKFTHFRMWYQKQLADYVRDMLLSPAALARPHVHPARLKQIVERHLEGKSNYTTQLHTLLTLELIQQRLASI